MHNQLKRKIITNVISYCNTMYWLSGQRPYPNIIAAMSIRLVANSLLLSNHDDES